MVLKSGRNNKKEQGQKLFILQGLIMLSFLVSFVKLDFIQKDDLMCPLMNSDVIFLLMKK